MKIFGNNYDVEVGRCVYTNNPFKLMKRIVEENKEVVIITPFTKVKEVINFNKNGGIDQFVAESESGIETYLSIENVNKIVESLNAIIGDELMAPNLDFAKFIKMILELSEAYVSEKNINSVLKFITKYATKSPQILIAGFDNADIDKTVPHLELISDFKNKVRYESIEGLLIELEAEMFEVYDLDAFISWLELKTKTALNHQMINNFLDGKVDISSYLISKALKELK